MNYMGSKNRIAKDILPIILHDRKPGQWYVEPFVGGGNTIDKVDGNRIGADINPYVIEALKLIRDNPESLPDHVSKEEYAIYKKVQNLDGVTGFVGFTCAFGARWFNTYARGVSQLGVVRSYASEGKRNAIRQSPLLKGVYFVSSSYKYLDIPPNSIIYCDPPYEGTKGYRDSFDSEFFWCWVREMIAAGHTVYISEYNAPDDFVSIWSKTILNSMNNVALKGPKMATEKLFVHESMLDLC